MGAVVTKLFNIAVNDCDTKKSAHCGRVLVVTELVVSGTQCILSLRKGLAHSMLSKSSHKRLMHSAELCPLVSTIEPNEVKFSLKRLFTLSESERDQRKISNIKGNVRILFRLV